MLRCNILSAMSSRFVLVDRDTPMPRGTGKAQMPPSMLLSLLIYNYAVGRMSSRQIEKATYEDVASRYICGGSAHPDHDTICAFRVQNANLFQESFVKVLEYAREMGVLSKRGGVSADGTKISANASKHAAVSYARAGEMLAQLELEVKELTERAQHAEAQEGKDPLDIPAELTRRTDRQAALQQARQIIEARAKELAAAQQPDYEAKQAKRQAQRDAGQKPRGPEPKAPSATPDPKAQYNFTDPVSGIMKAGSGAHFEQSYNAQIAVDQAMLIMGQRVSVAANDKQELVPSVAAISPVVAPQVKAILVDSGFYSEAAVQTVEQNPDGTATGMTVFAAVAKTDHHKTVADLLPQPEPAAPAPEANAKEKMAYRLKTKIGQELYKLRKQTVEPVFGIIKEVMGFRRFSLRGHAKVSLEWTLVCVSYNLKRLFSLKNLATTA